MIIHVPRRFTSNAWGGTEQVLNKTLPALQDLGFASEIAIPPRRLMPVLMKMLPTSPVRALITVTRNGLSATNENSAMIRKAVIW